LKVRIETEDGHIFIPMELPEHGEDILKIMDKYLGILLLISRGHIKSTLLQVYTIRKMCDWGIKFLYIGGSKEEVTKYTENIRTALKTNKSLLYHYGYLPSKKGDSKKGLHLRTDQRAYDKDPHMSIGTIPKGSAGVSSLGGHADCILMDDVQGEEISESETLRRKQKNWFDRQIMPMRKGKTRLIIAGTRKDPDDLYAYIKNKQFIPVLEKPAIVKFPNLREDEKYFLTEDPLTKVKYYDGGQQEEGEPEDPDAWYYEFTDYEEIVGDGHVMPFTLLTGVKNLRGGVVFWKDFRKERWETRTVKYYNKDGSIDKNRMAMQELLIEKYSLEHGSDEERQFSFWSEYQLMPIERKGKHFDITQVQFYQKDIWHKIVGADCIPKYTWVDVGYALPDTKRNKTIKDTKKGKTVFCTCAWVDPNMKGVRELFSDEEAGIYLLENRAGNFYLKHNIKKYDLQEQARYVFNMFKSQTICFEENFFGKYIRANTALSVTDLPIEGKKNTLDKWVRISNGLNVRLSDDHFRLYMCKETLGFAKTYRQLTNFPHVGDVDEIDALESCDRLLIRRSSGAILVGRWRGPQGKNEGLGGDGKSFNSRTPVTLVRSGSKFLKPRY